MSNKNHLHVRALTEGAILLALAVVLNYLSAIIFGSLPQGGSITLAMFPLLLYVHRWGVGRGALVCFAYGTLDMLLDGGYAWGWQSILLDYLLAYTMLGLGGAFREKLPMGVALPCGAALAIALRFVCHVLSGYILFSGWAEWFFTQDGFPAWGASLVEALSPNMLGFVYSLVYNGMYMVPEILLTAAAALLVARVPRIVEKVI